MKGYWSHRREVLSWVLQEGRLVKQTRRTVVGVTGRATGLTDETYRRRCYMRGYWLYRLDVLSSALHEGLMVVHETLRQAVDAQFNQTSC